MSTRSRLGLFGFRSILAWPITAAAFGLAVVQDWLLGHGPFRLTPFEIRNRSVS